jgi:TPR repeat protein
MNSRSYHSCFSVVAVLFAFLAGVSPKPTKAAPPSPQTPNAQAALDPPPFAERGNSAAQYRLARKLLAHNPSNDDIQAALKLLCASAAQNDRDAEFYLGYLYEHGQYVPQDFARAFKNYETAAQVHYPPAENNLASLYQHGQGVPQNDGKAFELYFLAAQHGDPIGQINLANLYIGGVGTPRNESEAVHWLRLSADSGLPEARNNLAYFYFKGIVVRRDYAEAARLIRLAAQAGDPQAQTNLGYLYEKGKGVPLDYVSAYSWYSRAISAGDNTGSERRSQLAHIMTHRQLDTASALITAYSSEGPLQPSRPTSTSKNSLFSH